MRQSANYSKHATDTNRCTTTCNITGHLSTLNFNYFSSLNNPCVPFTSLGCVRLATRAAPCPSARVRMCLTPLLPSPGDAANGSDEGSEPNTPQIDRNASDNKVTSTDGKSKKKEKEVRERR